MKVSFLMTLALVALGSQFAFASEPSLQKSMIDDLGTIRNEFKAQYAPAAWKSKNFGWDIDKQIDAVISEVQKNPKITVKDYHKLLSKFFLSMKDYHVSVSFVSTEMASLPLTIEGTGGKYFLVQIDRSKLPESTFPFHEGDEVVTFGDLKMGDAVNQVREEIGHNTDATDLLLAQHTLTRRQAARGNSVPKGPITLALRPQGTDKVITQQLIWDYKPELVGPGGAALNMTLGNKKGADHGGLFTAQMVAPYADFKSDLKGSSENPFALGARKSFIPDLGTKVWQSDDSDPFYAYIYRTPDRRLIGYVRIASYGPSDIGTFLNAFAKLIATFESSTDGMIIDQVNNPGGSIFYLYTLASMLTDQAMSTPRHHLKITQADVASSVDLLDKLANVKTDSDAQAALGTTLEGYPMSLTVAQFLDGFANFLVDQWNQGKRLTDAWWVNGVDKINPSSVHYTKPIALLINSLDFSGGDFFPAILQDSKRAKIIGTRTAGAGGYVLDVTYPNTLGVEGFRVTGSIAERVDKNPIENLGVKPDVEVALTQKDYTDNFSDYVKAVQSAVDSFVK